MIKAGLTLAEWIARLSKGYVKFTGKQPDGLAKIKIKMEAAEKVRQQDKILKPDFSGSLREFKRKEDLYEGNKKQPNPFKKAPDEVTDQIEMDFTDWDPKGMKGGGIAHMLGQPRVPMMYGGDPGFAFEYGGSWADWNDNHKHMMPVTEYIGTKLPKDRLPFRQDVADGGRIGFDKGGFNKGRRNFLKLAAGLASLPFVGKLFKGAKVASKIVPLKNTTTHMPAWFPDFVDKVMAKGVGKKIDADIMQYEVKELPNIKVTRHDDGSVFVEGQNDYYRSYDIEYRPPGHEVVDYQTGKAVKTKGDFTASEEVPVNMDMDGNTDFEGEILEEVGDILTSDGRKLEEFATGKKIKGSTRGEHRVGQAEVAMDNLADEAVERAAMEADDFAKGGLAHMLGE